MEDIQSIIDTYGRINRLVGDYRACVAAADMGSEAYTDSRRLLKQATRKLAKMETKLENLGLMNFEDRYTDRGEAE